MSAAALPMYGHEWVAISTHHLVSMIYSEAERFKCDIVSMP